VKIKIFGFLVLVLVVVLIFSRGWTERTPRIEILTSKGNKKASFKVELARTKEERARGLMFRKKLPEDWGMLFIFDQEKEQWFWMKNTFISLDIIFINQARQIVGIIKKAIPRTEMPLGGWKSRFVLEINGGLAEKYGIKEGDRIEFRHIDI